jgi:sensor histidine kinase YesM
VRNNKSRFLSKGDKKQIPVFWKAFLAMAIVTLLWTLNNMIVRFVIFPVQDNENFISYGHYLKGYALLFISIMLVATILILIFEIPRKKIRPRWWHLLLLAVIAYPATIAVFLVYNILFSGFRAVNLSSFPIYNGLQYYPELLLIMLAYAVILYYENARLEHENALKAEALANEAKWQMLRYQVNPHFLFNSLNSIMALINEDKKLARSVVNELSSYFRHTLSWNGKSLISVDEELHAVMHYLYIQKIRFENRIHISFNIEDEIREFLIPVFGLQSLIENAIKYGIKTHEGEVNIMVEAYRERDNIIIKVSNTGKLFKHDSTETDPDKDGTRSGLENLKGRLDLLYPEKNSLTLYENEGMVIAEIKINTVSSLVK